MSSSVRHNPKTECPETKIRGVYIHQHHKIYEHPVLRGAVTALGVLQALIVASVATVSDPLVLKTAVGVLAGVGLSLVALLWAGLSMERQRRERSLSTRSTRELERVHLSDRRSIVVQSPLKPASVGSGGTGVDLSDDSDDSSSATSDDPDSEDENSKIMTDNGSRIHPHSSSSKER